MTENEKVTIEFEYGLKDNAELIFAYQMRDQVAVRGQLAVQKEFAPWFRSYISDKLEQEAKAIRGRIEQKKWNMVVELQKKFGYTLAEATKQIFGEALLTNTVVNNIVQPTKKVA